MESRNEDLAKGMQQRKIYDELQQHGENIEYDLNEFGRISLY